LATPLALFLLPRAFHSLKANAFIRPLIGLTLLAVCVGVLLELTVPLSLGGSGNLFNALAVALWIVEIPLLGITVAYALCQIDLRPGLVALAAGALAGGILYTPSLFTSNLASTWKYLLGYPVSALVLALIGRSRPPAAILATLGLAGIAFLASARSLGLILIVAAALTLIVKVRGSSVWSAAPRVIIAATISATFLAIAMGNGWLGSSLQQLDIQETSQGQSLLLGGRPEFNATFALMQVRAVGFGIGTLPSVGVADVAVNAVSASGGYTGAYYETTVFNGRVDLHSGVSNLWYHFGIGGLALAALLGLIFLKGGLSMSLLARSLQPCGQFLIWYGAWDLAASPIDNFPHISIAIGVSLAVMSTAIRQPSRRAC